MVTLRRVLLAMLLLPTLILAALPPELVPLFNAIRVKESASHPWSIYDNTAAKSYRLASRAEAEKLAKDLVSRGHNLDLGLFQLNWQWQQKRPGLTLDNVFDPVMNESVAQTVLAEFYATARTLYSNIDDAIRMAVGAYNNGKVRVHNPRYVNGVYRIAGLPHPYADEGGAAAVASAPPVRGAGPAEEDWGVASELSRWFKGAPSLAALLHLADDDMGDQATADDESPATLIAAVLAIALVAGLLILGLLLGLKLIPLLFGTAGLFAKRAALFAVLRMQRRIASETSRLARM